MRPRSALFEHQQLMAARVANLAQGRSETAVLLDIGWGKTAGTLTGVVDADALPSLVVAPKLVAESTWSDEAREWEHLSGLRVEPLTGTAPERLAALARKPDVATISYENLIWLTDEIDIDSRFRSIVWDELSRMKTPGTKRFMRMRARGMEIPVRVGATGSPVPNHLLDVWGEMFMVAGEKPLGPRYTDYKDRYFETVDFHRRVWRLKGMTKDGEHTTISKPLETEIHKRIAPWCLALPPNKDVQIPPVFVNEVRCTMPARVQEKQQQLIDELFTLLDSGVELEALSKSALSVKLQQFASGAVYTDKEKTWEELHTAKVDRLADLVQEQQGEPVLLFYWYQHEPERIKRALRKIGATFAEIEEPGARERWNARQLEVLLAHPASAGAGLNLQHGGHNTVWFTLPWPHWLWTQGNGRLARTGQKASRVTASALLCGPADERVLDVLRRKGAAEKALYETLIHDVSDLL